MHRHCCYSIIANPLLRRSYSIVTVNTLTNVLTSCETPERLIAVFLIAERQVGAAPQSPIKAKFTADNGAQISVVVRPAAEIRPTFLQV